MAKTITVTEEFDKDGKLIKRTTTTIENDGETLTYPIYPTYPYYPSSPSVPNPWWVNPVTYGGSADIK